MAEHAAGDGILGGSFFFSRDEDNRKTARSFFPTLAYHLALRHAEFARRISELIEENRDVAQRGIQTQFNILIATPLRQMRVDERILIVIDALDECEDEEAESILTLLSRNIEGLAHLKVFVTARPEQAIRNVLSDRSNHEQFNLHDIEESIAEGDIRLYLQFRLSKKEVERALGPQPWQPTEEQLEKLVEMSGKVFIIASTATSFILDRKRSAPWERLALLLDGASPPDGSRSGHPLFMDQIYMQIIQAAQPEPPGNWVNLFQMVVGTIVLLRDPLPCKELAELLGIDGGDVQSTLSNLHSLLAPKGENQTFRVHHKSFLDFITDSDRCKLGQEFRINPTTHHLRIAKCCLAAMARDLKPNMCNLTRNEWHKDRAELHDRAHCISPALAYACTYWASHLMAGVNDETGSDAEVGSLLQNFASTCILIWLEALSIIGRMDTAYVSLDVAGRIIQRSSRFAAICSGVMQNVYHKQSPIYTAQEMFNDAYELVQRSFKVISANPMGIYHSALPFIPHDTALSHVYRALHTDRVDVISGSTAWDAAITALKGHSEAVNSVTFSQDGTRLVSASYNKTFRVWDAIIGTHIATLNGHSHQSTSLAILSDGLRFASTSSATTMQLWGGEGDTHIATLEGHSRLITSITFASDGSRLASGSWDTTVQRCGMGKQAHTLAPLKATRA